MEVVIRHQLSETSEEVYVFTLEFNYIKYQSVWLSNRDDKDDIWGYDWRSTFNDKRADELIELDKYEDEISEEEYAKRENEIRDKYNPCCSKTKLGLPRLTGMSGGGYMWKDHPPKLGLDELDDAIKKEFINKLMTMKIK